MAAPVAPAPGVSAVTDGFPAADATAVAGFADAVAETTAVAGLAVGADVFESPPHAADVTARIRAAAASMLRIAEA